MSRFDTKVKLKLRTLESKYPNRTLKKILSLWWFCFMCLSDYCLKSLYIKKTSSKNGKARIAFNLKGGLGDIIIGLNYVYHFHKYCGSENFEIDVYISNSNPKAFISLISADYKEIIKNCYQGLCNDTTGYALILDIIRFPEVLYYDKNIISNFPHLELLLKKYSEFIKKNYILIDNEPYLDSVENRICLNMGFKRINQSDIGKILNIGEEFAIPVPVANEKEVLEKYGITGKFITINRSCGDMGIVQSTKLWPYEHYNALIAMIKKEYPSLDIVQIGRTEQTEHIIKGIDKNLVGKTNFDELKVLLKNSFVHIDSEGGLVHLRKALRGGKSIVMFGPTHKEIYGYSSNANIKAENVCPGDCEWLSSEWQLKCLKTGTTKSPCMEAITPERVFTEFEKICRE